MPAGLRKFLKLPLYLLHLLISFLVMTAAVATVLCSGVPPALLGVISKKRSRKLASAIAESTPLM